MSREYQAGQFAPRNGAVVKAFLPNGGLLGYFAGTPTASITGYNPGAIAIDITNSRWYRNSGTVTSATWVREDSGGITTLTVTQANITTAAVGTLTGNAAGTTIAVTDRMTTTDGVSSGTARVIGGLAFSQTTASTAIASTSAETLFDQSYTIPANTLKVGTVVKIKYFGIQTTVIGTDTNRQRLYIGGSGGSLLADSVAAAGANSATFSGDAVVTCRTTGASGTVVGYGEAAQPIAGQSTVVYKNTILNSATLNTTTAQAIVLTNTFNTTNANSIRTDGLIVEIY